MSQSVTVLAKRIMDKWSRMVFGISTSFYEGQRHGDEDEDEDLGSGERHHD